MSYSAVCAGPITEDASGAAICVDGWQQVVHAAPFDWSMIDPVLIAAYLGSGFFIMLPIWVAIVGGRALIHAIH